MNQSPTDCTVQLCTLSTGQSIPLTHRDGSFLLICLDGELCVTLNERTLMLPSCCLLICPPNSLLQMKCNSQCTFIHVSATPAYLSKRYNYWKQILPMMMSLKDKNLVMLTETEAARYERMYACIAECKANEPHTTWTQEALDASIYTLLCSLFAKINEVCGQEEQETDKRYPYRGEEYFARFMKLLSQHYKQERRVEFYASELCVTPKYLSFVIKEVSGKTPSKWIDEAIMQEIHYQLKSSTISIKEIAYRLNFTNASFFGKFVKKFTGMSPGKYRAAKCG
ncbi:MAG: helix-turn-helix domain-containing protein [Bacteroides sp.]|nr:helix-turn-helix domain-containing protein [Bacteroides sp.]